MDQVHESPLSRTVTAVIDAALDDAITDLHDRALVSTHDVADLLLDLRSSLRRSIELAEAMSLPEPSRARAAWTAAAERAARLGAARRPRSHVPTLFRTRSAQA
jgi:hypothetical protein